MHTYVYVYMRVSCLRGNSVHACMHVRVYRFLYMYIYIDIYRYAWIDVYMLHACTIECNLEWFKMKVLHGARSIEYSQVI